MVSGYAISFELYWGNLIYGMVWFWQWLIWILGGAFGKQCITEFNGLKLMAWLMYWWLLVVVYFEIECRGRWKRCELNARHSILLPSGHHPSMVIVAFGFDGG
jgi:hypothetical protein